MISFFKHFLRFFTNLAREVYKTINVLCIHTSLFERPSFSKILLSLLYSFQKAWVAILSQERPTLAFHASITNPFGKGALINLLRQFSKVSNYMLSTSSDIFCFDKFPSCCIVFDWCHFKTFSFIARRRTSAAGSLVTRMWERVPSSTLSVRRKFVTWHLWLVKPRQDT